MAKAGAILSFLSDVGASPRRGHEGPPALLRTGGRLPQPPPPDDRS